MPKLLFHMYWPYLMWVIFQKEKLVGFEGYQYFRLINLYFDPTHFSES